jgi:hypothetical protein
MLAPHRHHASGEPCSWNPWHLLCFSPETGQLLLAAMPAGEWGPAQRPLLVARAGRAPVPECRHVSAVAARHFRLAGY